jgi:predicted Fe-Mo cluster-binding NifX family protein
LHAISDRIEDKIRDHVPYVERVIIHYEPVVRSQIIYAVPMRDLAGTVNEEFGTAPYFGLVTVRTSDKELEKIEVLANPHANLQKGRGIHVAEWLVTRNVDIVFVKEDLSDKGPSFVLSNAGVQFRKVSGKTLDEVLEAALSFIRNRE